MSDCDGLVENTAGGGEQENCRMQETQYIWNVSLKIHIQSTDSPYCESGR